MAAALHQGLWMTGPEILDAVKQRLPQGFDELEKPEEKLHYLVKAVSGVLEEQEGLGSNWILANGDMTLIELLTDKS